MPRPGDIGVVRINNDVGLAIRVAQFLNGDGFIDREHAFVYTGGPDKVVEAEPGGARLGSFTAEYGNDDVLWLVCPDEFRLGVMQAALSLLGTPYSFADYLALAALRLHLPSRWLRKYVASSKHMICSQLADEAARRGGWHIFTDGRPSQDVTPADLANAAKEWN